MLTVQYKQLAPAAYNVPLDKFGWGDVCAIGEKYGGEVSGFKVRGADGVRFSIKARGGDKYEIRFKASKLLGDPSAQSGSQIPPMAAPSPESVQDRSDWEGTIAIGPGQTVALPLDGAKWHVTVMRIADPLKVVTGNEGNDPCW